MARNFISLRPIAPLAAPLRAWPLQAWRCVRAPSAQTELRPSRCGRASPNPDRTPAICSECGCSRRGSRGLKSPRGSRGRGSFVEIHRRLLKGCATIPLALPAVVIPRFANPSRILQYLPRNEVTRAFRCTSWSLGDFAPAKTLRSKVS